jgi:hypothetical protein
MARNRTTPVVALLAALLLAGCGASRPATGPNLGASYHEPGLSCAPFARELSGIALYGEANTWWNGAAGRYRRSYTPEPGAVLVFRRSARLPSGHVAVVSAVLGPRQMHVIQANWVPDELDVDQLVVDVSEHNDWTAVRVWYPPANQMGGSTYAAWGFILPPRPVGRDELEHAIRPAAAYGLDTTGRPPPRARTM